ncbi:hypothetical protein NQZ68_035225 [Dissostichus eleginoides]|nr:hypothetical protein NQZ68_035225 [Dissostichus eleginoides]
MGLFQSIDDVGGQPVAQGKTDKKCSLKTPELEHLTVRMLSQVKWAIRPLAYYPAKCCHYLLHEQCPPKHISSGCDVIKACWMGLHLPPQ